MPMLPEQAQQVARLTREVELLRAEVAAQQLALASLGDERDAARAGGFDTQDRLKVRAGVPAAWELTPAWNPDGRLQKRLSLFWSSEV